MRTSFRFVKPYIYSYNARFFHVDISFIQEQMQPEEDSKDLQKAGDSFKHSNKVKCCRCHKSLSKKQFYCDGQVLFNADAALYSKVCVTCLSGTYPTVDNIKCSNRERMNPEYDLAEYEILKQKLLEIAKEKEMNRQPISSPVEDNETARGVNRSFWCVAAHFAAQLLHKGFVVIPLHFKEGNDVTGVNAKSMVDDEIESHCAFLRDSHLTPFFQRCFRAHLMRSQEPQVPAYQNFRERGEGRYELISKKHIEIPLLQLMEKTAATSQLSQTDEPKSTDFGLASAVCELVFHLDGISSTVATVKESITEKNENQSMKILGCGCFLATAGSKRQNFHTDGPPLTPHVDTLPYAINCFVPLVELGPHNGTEFCPRSHRPLRELARRAELEDDFPIISALRSQNGNKLSASLKLSKKRGRTDSKLSESSRKRRQPVSSEDLAQADSWPINERERPCVKVGEAILFDYRVIHRGLENKTLNMRPTCYLTFCRPWYNDLTNFSTTRYRRALDNLSSSSDDDGGILLHNKQSIDILTTQ